MGSIYDHTCTAADGSQTSMDEFRGRVLLIVNTASKCGFTSQYKGLEALHQEYSERGLSVLGFPCNQFGGQEPGDNSEIQSFCELNFGVTFPVLGKIEVNGDGAHPLFKQLKSEAKGILGTEKIKWNFTKFLVNRDGMVVARFAPTDTPESLKKHIEQLL